VLKQLKKIELEKDIMEKETLSQKRSSFSRMSKTSS